MSQKQLFGMQLHFVMIIHLKLINYFIMFYSLRGRRNQLSKIRIHLKILKTSFPLILGVEACIIFWLFQLNFTLRNKMNSIKLKIKKFKKIFFVCFSDHEPIDRIVLNSDDGTKRMFLVWFKNSILSRLISTGKNQFPKKVGSHELVNI